MFFPYKDDNPRIVVPFVTYAIIALNLIVFIYQIGLGFTAGQEFTLSFGLIPATFTDLPRGEITLAYAQYLSEVTNSRIFLNSIPNSPYITAFTSMFMHGSWLHLFGNMLFLWIFGNNIEDFLGKIKYILFYLLSGLGASMVHIIFHPNSLTPVIGASGAVSGIMGAYLILYPTARVRTLVFVFIFVTFVDIPAFVFLVVWFLFQFLYVGGQGVAWLAHVGGFLIGLLLIKLWRQKKPKIEIIE